MAAHPQSSYLMFIPLSIRSLCTWDQRRSRRERGSAPRARQCGPGLVSPELLQVATAVCVLRRAERVALEGGTRSFCGPPARLESVVYLGLCSDSVWSSQLCCIARWVCIPLRGTWGRFCGTPQTDQQVTPLRTGGARFVLPGGGGG